MLGRLNPFPLILNPPTPDNKTSPLLHIGTILGGFNIGGLGGFSIRGKGLASLLNNWPYGAYMACYVGLYTPTQVLHDSITKTGVFLVWAGLATRIVNGILL